MHENYIGLGAFGTATMFIDEPPNRRGLRYKAISLANSFISTNHQGWTTFLFFQ